MKWNELRRDIEDLFRKKSEKLDIRPNLDLHLIEDAPVEEEHVYGEALPNENKLWLEVVAPDASDNEILEILCHELVHLKYPGWDHESDESNKKVKECMGVL